MPGKVRPLAGPLDLLTDGRRLFEPWPLAELLAAGLDDSAIAAVRGRPELGTDAAAVAAAHAALVAAGLLPLGANDRPRVAELAFLARGYAGAPGAIGVAMTSDGGADRLGADDVTLDLWPASGRDGLVVGQLLIDPRRPDALVSVSTPRAAAEDLVDHLAHRGHPPAVKVLGGTATLTLLRGSRLTGLTSSIRTMQIFQGEDLCTVDGERHGLRRGPATMSLAETVEWLADTITATVG